MKPLCYTVEYWGSDPSLDNDDLWTSCDFSTLDEARSCLAMGSDDPDQN